MAKNILLLIDNEVLLNRFKELVDKMKLESDLNFIFNYTYSPNNKEFKKKFINTAWIKPLKITDNIDFLIDKYQMIFSIHCKQLFPPKLVNSIKCINVHPGLNPNNRGWYPQVFSIINGLPCGATIHEMDVKLDNGPMICQKEVKIENWDTSLTAYNKILDTEMILLENNIINILNLEYKTTIKNIGNLNLKQDFDNLCEINLDDKDTFKNHINKLRALTHGDYSNAYFLEENGNKIYLKLELKKE